MTHSRQQEDDSCLSNSNVSVGVPCCFNHWAATGIQLRGLWSKPSEDRTLWKVLAMLFQVAVLVISHGKTVWSPTPQHLKGGNELCHPHSFASYYQWTSPPTQWRELKKKRGCLHPGLENRLQYYFFQLAKYYCKKSAWNSKISQWLVVFVTNRMERGNQLLQVVLHTQQWQVCTYIHAQINKNIS